jgi:hypothetical protein
MSSNFEIKNTIVAGKLTFPVVSDTYNPIIVADNSPGKIQFTNITFNFHNPL